MMDLSKLRAGVTIASMAELGALLAQVRKSAHVTQAHLAGMANWGGRFVSDVENGAGYRLVPFYDLMCTSIYPGFSREFSFRIGTTFKPGAINPNQLQRFAAALGVSDKLLRKHAGANQIR